MNWLDESLVEYLVGWLGYFNLTWHLPRRLIGRFKDLVLCRWSQKYWFPNNVLVVRGVSVVTTVNSSIFKLLFLKNKFFASQKFCLTATDGDSCVLFNFQTPFEV